MKLYELQIDGEETEVYFNSIVNIPAHMKAALKFSETLKAKAFHFNEELQVMSGVMVAVDEPIYRYNPETKEEFNVVFRKSFADKLIRDYMSKGYANNLNFDHVEGKNVNSAYLMEIYQIDKSRGNTVPEAFASQDLQDGSIIVSYHIPDKQEWKQAKQRGGFSIEGVFELIEVNNKNEEKMSLLKKLGFGEKPKQNKETFKATAQKFGEATLEDGTVIYWDGEIGEGVDVFVDVDGVMTPAPDGTHVLTTGEIVETSGGVVVTYTGIEDDAMEDKDKEQEFATVAEVVAAFEAFEAKLMDAFTSKINEVSESFEARLKAKDEAFAALKSQFEAVKKIAPEPKKEKFNQNKNPKPSAPAFDFKEMVRAKQN